MIHDSRWGRDLLRFSSDLAVCPFSETTFEGSAPVEGNLAPTRLRASLELSVLEMQLSTLVHDSWHTGIAVKTLAKQASSKHGS